MNPYIGDRQLEPDDGHECPYCESVFTSKHELGIHMRKCPDNDGARHDSEDEE